MREFKPRDRILHPLFGPGTIAAVSGSGAEARLTIDFASQVGRKKLVAGLARITALDGESAVQTATQASGEWYENLTAGFRALRKAPLDAKASNAEIRSRLGSQIFWVALRERLRASGAVPKALDDIDGRVSVALNRHHEIHISVRHDSPAEAKTSRIAATLLETLRPIFPGHLEIESVRTETGTQPHCEDESVAVEDLAIALPDRAPRQRPKPVQPKGTIRSIPRRRDDY